MKKTPFVLAVSLAVLLSACGNNEGETPESAAPETSAPAPETTAPEAAAPEAAPAPEAAAPAAEGTAVAAAGDVGKKVYGNVCSMCHAAGVAGAPKPGDKADWGPRIAQGNDVLYTHAIEGFTGSKGMMPARGGSTTLSDEEVKAAVDFMVAQSK
jgi:cytochrome c5